MLCLLHFSRTAIKMKNLIIAMIAAFSLVGSMAMAQDTKKPDAKKPGATRNAKGQFVKKDKKDAPKKDEKKPEAKKDEKKPEVKKGDKKDGPERDAKGHFVKKDKKDAPAKVEKAEKVKPAKTEKAEKPAKADKPAKAEKPAKAGEHKTYRDPATGRFMDKDKYIKAYGDVDYATAKKKYEASHKKKAA